MIHNSSKFKPASQAPINTAIFSGPLYFGEIVGNVLTRKHWTLSWIVYRHPPSPSQLASLDMHARMVLQCIMISTAFDRVDEIHFWE
jgi:hypothetical protein